MNEKDKQYNLNDEYLIQVKLSARLHDFICSDEYDELDKEVQSLLLELKLELLECGTLFLTIMEKQRKTLKGGETK